MTIKYVIILFIGLIIGVFAGYLGYGFVVGKNSCTVQDQNDTYAAGWQAARDRLEETGYYYQLGEDAFADSVTGNIESIGQNEIIVDIMPLSPLADKDLDKRSVLINSKTDIIEKVEKPNLEYQEELNKFWKENPALVNKANIELPLPSPYIDQEVDFNSFKVGQNLLIYAEKDIRKDKIFPAIKVIIQ